MMYRLFTIGALLCHVALASVDQGEIYLQQGKYQEALSELLPHVEKGDVKACFFTALVRLFSEEPETEEGLRLLHYAANKGFNPALDTLAGLYLHGEFVPQDRFQALRYYEMAAQRGYGPSQFNCGIMYKNGDKIPKDLESAFVYLSMAALNKGDLDELTIDAAGYRDEVVKAMSTEQYQRALERMNQVIKSIKVAKKRNSR